MAGHQINVGLDDIALRKAAKKALDEALKDMRMLSEEQLVAILARWIETAPVRLELHKAFAGEVDLDVVGSERDLRAAKVIAAQLVELGEQLEAEQPST